MAAIAAPHCAQNFPMAGLSDPQLAHRIVCPQARDHAYIKCTKDYPNRETARHMNAYGL